MKKSKTYKGAPKPYGKRGHFNESRRHSLQARGIKTGNLRKPLFPAQKPIVMSRVAGWYQMKGYKKQSEKLDKEFDKLWDLPDTPERTEKFRQKREKKLYPLIRNVLLHREDTPKKINWDYTDVPLVMMAYEGEEGHIEWMSPEDFLKLASPTVPYLSSIFGLYDRVQEGEKIPVGFLEVNEDNEIDGHEGRHRALVMRMFGVEKMPVAISGEGHNKFDRIKTKSERRNVDDEALQDTDFDGFPDLYDCDPTDPTKQGLLHEGKVQTARLYWWSKFMATPPTSLLSEKNWEKQLQSFPYSRDRDKDGVPDYFDQDVKGD